MKRKLNLAIISPNQNAYSETFIQAHRNVDANVFFYYGGFLPIYLEDMGKISAEGIRYAFFLIKKKFGFAGHLSYRSKCLKNSFKQKSIQIVLAEYGPSGVEVLPVCKDLNIPLIVHFHGFDASAKETLKQYKAAYFELFQYARNVIVVSNKMTEALLQLGCPFEKIVLNPYGPADSFFAIENGSLKKQFVAVGRFVAKKAPHLTILAFQKVLAEIPDAKLIMAGNGELLGVCKNLVKVFGLQENIEFIGAISPDTIQRLFSESIAFVQHSIVAEDGDSEGTPVAVLEASAAGMPIIATKHAGILDVVIHGETGFLVEELDIENMAGYMLQLARQPELAKQMGCNGRKRVKENFSMKKHLDMLSSIIYQSILPSCLDNI